MSRKVRSRHGVVRIVNDNYVLQDGETQVVELPFMDAIMVHDGRGQPAGQRPGFLYGNDTNRQAVVDAYAEYDDAIRQRWRGSDDEAEPLAFDSPEEALEAAYADYQRRIGEAWRK